MPDHTGKIEYLETGTMTQMVHLPWREFPGVVIQGDMLVYWLMKIENIHARASIAGDRQLEIDSDLLRAQIRNVVVDYDRTCKELKRGGFIRLPGSKEPLE